MCVCVCEREREREREFVREWEKIYEIWFEFNKIEATGCKSRRRSLQNGDGLALRGLCYCFAQFWK